MSNAPDSTQKHQVQREEWPSLPGSPAAVVCEEGKSDNHTSAAEGRLDSEGDERLEQYGGGQGQQSELVELGLLHELERAIQFESAK